RMAVVVGPGIDGQFVEQRGVQTGIGEDGWVGGVEQVESTSEDGLETAVADAGAADIERNGPDALVVIRFALGPGLEDGDGPMADIVVELFEGAGDDAVGAIPWSALGEHGLEDASEEERLEEVAVAQVEEQVGVVAPVGRQDGGEDEREDRFDLGG